MEYVELDSFDGPLRLRFQAPVETALLPVEVGPQGCWWSNSGDSINSTLTRTVDLRGLDRATLSYQVWYNLEESWDYAYLEVSIDEGRSWDILETAHTSPENPIGNNFGTGYTGDSPGMGRRVGRPRRLRRPANSAPLPVRHRRRRQRLGPLHPADCHTRGGATGRDRRLAGLGFVLTDNRVRQDYLVQVIEVSETNRVTVMPLDQANLGELIVPAPQTLDRLVVAVAALAPKTRQPAPYTLTVGPAD